MERGSQILRGGANFGAVAVATAVRIFSPSRRGGIAAVVPSDVDGDDETAADPTFTDRPPTDLFGATPAEPADGGGANNDDIWRKRHVPVAWDDSDDDDDDDAEDDYSDDDDDDDAEHDDGLLEMVDGDPRDAPVVPRVAAHVGGVSTPVDAVHQHDGRRRSTGPRSE